MGCIYTGLIRQSDLSSDIFIFIPGGGISMVLKKKRNSRRQTIGVILSWVDCRGCENKLFVEEEDFIPQFVYVKEVLYQSNFELDPNIKFVIVWGLSGSEGVVLGPVVMRERERDILYFAPLVVILSTMSHFSHRRLT